MIFILDLLRKIQEDKREDPKAYLIIYKESNSTKELKFDNIKDINKLYVIFELENKQFTVPVHRIREIRKENKILWKREQGQTSMGETIHEMWN